MWWGKDLTIAIPRQHIIVCSFTLMCDMIYRSQEWYQWDTYVQYGRKVWGWINQIGDSTALITTLGLSCVFDSLGNVFAVLLQDASGWQCVFTASTHGAGTHVQVMPTVLGQLQVRLWLTKHLLAYAFCNIKHLFTITFNSPITQWSSLSLICHLNFQAVNIWFNQNIVENLLKHLNVEQKSQAGIPTVASEMLLSSPAEIESSNLKQLLYTQNHITFNVAEILNPFVYRLATAVVLAIWSWR